MSNSSSAGSLQELLKNIENSYANQSRVSVDDVLKKLGRRSFGSVLLTIGLIYSTPVVGDIPGVPTILGLIIVLVGGQLVVGRKSIWIPQVLLRQSVAADKMDAVMRRLRPVAKKVDQVLRPRLHGLTNQTATIGIASLSCVIALFSPAMELIPFSANVAGVSLVAFGLGFIANDGLMHLIGIIFFLLVSGLLTYGFVAWL